MNPCCKWIVLVSLGCSLASGRAQVPAGGAIVLGDPPNLMQVVDAAGAAAFVTGLDPASQAASSVLLTADGLLWVGLRARNTGGGAALSLRLVVVSGSVAVDVPFATLMPVPVGEEWAVADMKERDDGSLLLLATEVVGGPNPMAAGAVLLVDRSGAVQSVPAVGLAPGVPTAIADLGDRYAVAVDQPFFSRNFGLQSLAYDGIGPTFDIAQLVNVGSFGGFDRDVSGELVFGATFAGSTASVHRLAPSQGAVPVPVPGGPPVFAAAHVNRAGILSSLAFAPAPAGRVLQRTDTVLGGTVGWVTSLPGEGRALTVRDDPEVYGLPLVAAIPALGAQGGRPSVPNPAFALRVHAATAGVAFLGGAPVRASLPTAFGTLLVDPQSGIEGFGFTVFAAGQAGVFAVPLPPDPGLVGAAYAFQALVVPAAGPAVLSSGLGIVLQ